MRADGGFDQVEITLQGADRFFCGDWIRDPYTAISCCKDGLRPVYYKIELAE